MKQFIIPRLLKFNLNKIFKLVEEAGITYGQSQEIIEREKREIEKKLIDELNFVLYQSGSDGLTRHINHHLDQLNILTTKELEYFQRWHDPVKPYNTSNLFLAKFMSDIYRYILIENREQVIMSRKQTNYSFTWEGTPDELRMLFKKMIDSKLIAADITEADFKAVFETKPLDEIKKPITWKKTNALLAYFVDYLVYKKSSKDNFNKWKIAEACFKPCKHLKQSSINYRNNKTRKPKEHNLVDDLF